MPLRCRSQGAVYAFDLYHQGNYNVQRTPNIAKLPELEQFKEIVVLTDGATQSTAELVATSFRHFNRAYIVGSQTAGWGTVENTYPLTTSIDSSTSYAILIVHSVTLRDDNQPIQGRGVDPDVDVSDFSWKKKLRDYFRSPDLISNIIEEIQRTATF